MSVDVIFVSLAFAAVVWGIVRIVSVVRSIPKDLSEEAVPPAGTYVSPTYVPPPKEIIDFLNRPHP